MIDFVMKSGRALMSPIYKDTFERLGTPPEPGTIAERDETIQQTNDLRRSIDYLETRNDLDNSKLAFFGISWGAILGPIMITMDTRLKVAVLWVWRMRYGHCSPRSRSHEFCPTREGADPHAEWAL
jgi:eukaryotic-like serine/threonine-protein kinase